MLGGLRCTLTQDQSPTVKYQSETLQHNEGVPEDASFPKWSETQPRVARTKVHFYLPIISRIQFCMHVRRNIRSRKFQNILFIL